MEHVGTFLDSSGSQLSFEPKKYRILCMDLRENCVLRELPYHENKDKMLYLIQNNGFRFCD